METGEADAGAVPRRLFLAVLPTGPVREALVASQEALAPTLGKARPTAPGNLHLTLVFLGMCDEGQAEAAGGALREACACQDAFGLRLAGTGRFNKRRGDIVWQGLEEDAGARDLRAFRARLLAALHARGLALEVGDEYAPHVTLFRGVRKVVAEGGDDVGATRAASPAIGTPWPVTTASLMWSHHPEGGSLTYTELVRVPLGSPSARPGWRE